MKTIYSFALMVGIFLTLQESQYIDYWTRAPVDGMEIYTIYCAADYCYAISHNEEIFFSADHGNTWLMNNKYEIKHPDSDDFLWSGHIHCSAMKTTDGGINWTPCNPGMQEHFCRVYLKDPNSGYQPAQEFLKTVSKKVFGCIGRNDTEQLINHPQQCTEYYRNEAEGWAVGWCLKDFLVSEKISKIK